jgi:hypothetical protein
LVDTAAGTSRHFYIAAYFLCNLLWAFQTRIIGSDEYMVGKKPCKNTKFLSAVQCLATWTAKYRVYLKDCLCLVY